jgi:hypothetical protein
LRNLRIHNGDEKMADINRTIQELLVDYADSLRDGSIPTFLKSLSHEEGQLVASSREFFEAADVVRLINSAGFADKVTTPNVGLFMSRVNAEIASRIKKARAPSRRKRTRTSRPVENFGETEKHI